MGEYRVDGRGNSRRGQFAWRLLRGENELGRREEKDLSWSKFPRQLQQAATELVDKAAGTKVLPSDPVAEAKHLADREHAFVAIGQWKQGLAMAEASLLLNPDQPAVHGDALHAILEMNGDWQDLWAFSPKTIPWLRGRCRTWRPISAAPKCPSATSPTWKHKGGGTTSVVAASFVFRLKCARSSSITCRPTRPTPSWPTACWSTIRAEEVGDAEASAAAASTADRDLPAIQTLLAFWCFWASC